MTITQLENDGEVWSLEEDDGEMFIHYLINNHRLVIPLPATMLERMIARSRIDGAGNVRR